MAKIERKHQKIFAGDVPVTNVVAAFGSLAAGAAGYTGDPDGIQTTRYGLGWSQAVINNYAPCIQDLNALFYLITRQMAYIFQAGIPEWIATSTYYIGSLVHDAVGGIYMSLTNDNINQALTVAGQWVPIFSRKITDIGDNYTANNTDWFIRWSTANPNVDHATVTLPISSPTTEGEYWIVVPPSQLTRASTGHALIPLPSILVP